MKKYLIADFDGTINLNNNPDEINTIIDTLENKYEVILATGRNYFNFLAEFPDILSRQKNIIFSNGAAYIKNSVYHFVPFKYKTLKHIVGKKLFHGELILEIETGEKLSLDVISEEELEKVICLQIISENEANFLWNINMANSLNLGLMVTSSSYITLFDENINKLACCKQLLNEQAINIEKAIGNDVNDFVFYYDNDISTIIIDKNFMSDYFKNLHKFLEEDYLGV